MGTKLRFRATVYVDHHGADGGAARPVHIRRDHALFAGNTIPRRIADELSGGESGGVEGTDFALCPTLDRAVREVIYVDIAWCLRGVDRHGEALSRAVETDI